MQSCPSDQLLTPSANAIHCCHCARREHSDVLSCHCRRGFEMHSQQSSHCRGWRHPHVACDRPASVQRIGSGCPQGAGEPVVGPYVRREPFVARRGLPGHLLRDGHGSPVGTQGPGHSSARPGGPVRHLPDALPAKRKRKGQPDAQPRQADPAQPEESLLPPQRNSLPRIQAVLQRHADAVNENAPDQQGRRMSAKPFRKRQCQARPEHDGAQSGREFSAPGRPGVHG